MSERRRDARRAGQSVRLVAIGQVLLNAVLLVAGAWLYHSGLRIASFLFVLVPLAFIPFSYARVRLQRLIEAHLASSLLWPATVIGLLFDAVMLAQMLSARELHQPAILYARGVMWIGTVWFSAHALLLLGFACAGLGRVVSWPFRYARSRARPATIDVAEIGIGRRELLQKAGLLGAAVPFGVSLSGVSLSYDFRVERREITLPSWPQALDGLRVVHLSDIHVGGAMDGPRLRRVAALVNQCRPDLVAHTGDFLTHRAGDFDEPLYEALARIRAPYGQWACLGNHDFDDPERLERRLRESGVTLLRDRVATVALRGEPVEIAGIDFQFDRGERAALMRQTIESWGPRRATARILLNHDPTTFSGLPDDCAELVLSGHTHGGHIGIQLDSSHAITLVGLAGIPDQGLFTRGDMRMYVTRCVGFYGYPMRIGIPPEIALLILRSPRNV